MVENCAYLFLGDDEEAKQRKIDAIKSNYLDEGFHDINYEVVYADDRDLTPPRLNETLSYAPSSSKKRIVLIRRLRLLRKDNRDILLNYLKNPLPSLVVLLDATGMKEDDLFLVTLGSLAKKINLRKTKKLETFDLCRAVIAHNTSAAVKILNTLLGNREKPHHILGGLIWQWENMKDRLSLEQFQKGLQLLLYTDLRIKTGRMKENLALEMLIIRLSSLV